MSTQVRKVVADFETSLAAAISVSDTSFSLSSVADDDGVSLAAGDYCFTIDNGTASKEYLTGTLSGTTISSVKTVSRQGVETSGAAIAHRAGASVLLTNFVSLMDAVKSLRGEKLLDANNPLQYDGTATITNANQLATRAYVLSVVTGGTVSFDTAIIAGTAGETIAAGEAVYLNEADGKWYLTDADTVAKCVNVSIGIAQGAGATDDNITDGVLVAGQDASTSYTAGSKYYLSDTAGALSTSAGTNSVLVGVGMDGEKLLLTHVNTYNSVTPAEKASFAAAQSPLTGTNPVITEDDVSAALYDPSELTDDSSIAVGQNDATTKYNKVAQSFVAAKTKVSAITLDKNTSTGTYTGDVTVNIQADDGSGDPDGTDIVSATIATADWEEADGERVFTFDSEATLTVGNTYWIVVESLTASASNYGNLGANSAGGEVDILKYNNTTDGWVAVTPVLYYKVHEGLVSQVVRTNTSGEIPESMLQNAKAELKQGVGTKSNATWAHFHYPLIGEDNYTSGTTYLGSNDGSVWDVQNGGVTYYGYHAVIGTSTTSYAVLNNPFGIYDGITMNTTKQVIVEGEVAFTGTTTGESGWGFTSHSTYLDSYNQTVAASSVMAATFVISGGTVYAHNHNSNSNTNTEITDIDISEINTLRIEYDLGNTTPQIRYYVQGELKATHTTNLPSTASTMKFAVGHSSATSGILYISSFSSPYLAIEK